MKLLKTTKVRFMFTTPSKLDNPFKYFYWFRSNTEGWEFKYEIN